MHYLLPPLNTAFRPPTTRRSRRKRLRDFIAIVFCYIATGCATSGQVGLLDFNSNFKQNIPTSPQYKIETVGVNRYQVVVYQGASLLSERTTRAAYLTQAGLIAMEAHCLRRGAVVGTHTLRDSVDSFGYINVLGFFTCSPSSTPRGSDEPKKDPKTEI